MAILRRGSKGIYIREHNGKNPEVYIDPPAPHTFIHLAMDGLFLSEPGESSPPARGGVAAAPADAHGGSSAWVLPIRNPQSQIPNRRSAAILAAVVAASCGHFVFLRFVSKANGHVVFRAKAPGEMALPMKATSRGTRPAPTAKCPLNCVGQIRRTKYLRIRAIFAPKT